MLTSLIPRKCRWGRVDRTRATNTARLGIHADVLDADAHELFLHFAIPIHQCALSWFSRPLGSQLHHRRPPRLHSHEQKGYPMTTRQIPTSERSVRSSTYTFRPVPYRNARVGGSVCYRPCSESHKWMLKPLIDTTSKRLPSCPDALLLPFYICSHLPQPVPESIRMAVYTP